jgi:hypothetical protein
MPPQYLSGSVAVAQKLKQDPQVSYVLAQLRKSLHRSGLAGRLLGPDDEQAIFDEVSQTLMQSPSVLDALQQIPKP